MTWDEFKQEVDRQLAGQDKDGSIEIEYIDIQPDLTDDIITVTVEYNGLSMRI